MDSLRGHGVLSHQAPMCKPTPLRLGSPFESSTLSPLAVFVITQPSLGERVARNRRFHQSVS
jgi:hypothetical protein